MRKPPLIVFGLFAALCLVVIPAFAVSRVGDSQSGAVEVAARDQAARELFANNCGTCHTLAAAGTDGVVGPDLDQLLVPTGTNTAEEYDRIYSQAFRAVTCGIAGRMPKGILEEDETREVSAFIGAYAGQIGKGPTVNTGTVEAPAPLPCDE